MIDRIIDESNHPQKIHQNFGHDDGRLGPLCRQ